MNRFALSDIRLARLVVAVASAAAALLAVAAPALAHGERVQQAYLRTGTVSFYDLKFSKPDLKVGERFTITGRFYIPADWPEAAEEPKMAALTVAAPGPVVLMKNREIDGKFVPGSIELNLGRSYGFKMEMAARRPGRYHIHPMVSVKHVGPLLGPGVWINTTGSDNYKNVIALKNGGTADLESYNLGSNIKWHLIFLFPGLLFVGYWFSKPLVNRMARISTGVEPSDLVTKRDLKVTGAIAVLTLAIVVGGAVYSASEWPDGIPLQVRHDEPAGQVEGRKVNADSNDPAVFRPAEDSLTVQLSLENTTKQKLTARRFVTGGLTFGTAAATQALDGELRSDQPITLNPGEKKDVTFTLHSTQWVEEKLIPHKEVQVTVGGILLFEGDGGAQELTEISMPVFTEGKAT